MIPPADAAPAPPAAPPSRRAARAWWLVAMAAFCLLIALPTLLRPRSAPVERPPGPSPAAPRKTVVVLGFRNTSALASRDWLATALSEMLIEQLAQADDVRVVGGEEVSQLRAALGLTNLGELDAERLARVRAQAGADLVVMGGFGPGPEGPDHISLEVSVQDAAAARTVAQASFQGAEGDLPGLVARVTSDLHQRLALRPSPRSRPMPLNREAARLYAEGVERMRRFDALAARDLLARSVEIDPGFPLSRSALSAAWTALGYEARAAEEAQWALDLSDNLPSARRRWIEGRYREARRDWPAAVAVYESLFRYAPDDLDYGLSLAGAQTSGGRARDALRTVQQMRALPPPAREDPRLDVAESRAAHALSDYRLAREAAARAAAQGVKLGAQLLVATARLEEAQALWNLGEGKASIAAAEEASRIFRAAGDRGGVARATLQVADVLRYQGDLLECRRRAEDALAIARELGHRSAAAQALSRLATVVTAQGHLREGRRISEEARVVYAEVGNLPREGAALNHIGVALWHEGRLSAARRTLEDCVALFERLDDRRGIAFANANLGFVLLEQGELAAATQVLGRARKVSEEIGFRSVTAYVLRGLGVLALFRDQRPEARRLLQASIDDSRAMQQRGRVAEGLVSLARLQVLEGQVREAEAAAIEAAGEFAREQAPQDEAMAQVVLAEARLARGDAAGAETGLARARQLVDVAEHRGLGLQIQVVAAAVAAGQGRAAEARTLLDQAVAGARELGLVDTWLDGRLLRARLERAAGREEAARTELRAVAAEADLRGHTLLARLAREAQ